MQIFKIFILLAASLLASCSAAKTAPHNVAHENLIIYYDPEVGNEALLSAAKQYGSEILYIYNNINGIAVTVPHDKSLQDTVKYYENIKGVLSVNKDIKVQLY